MSKIHPIHKTKNWRGRQKFKSMLEEIFQLAACIDREFELSKEDPKFTPSIKFVLRKVSKEATAALDYFNSYNPAKKVPKGSAEKFLSR